jgi:hypothetical protein
MYVWTTCAAQSNLLDFTILTTFGNREVLPIFRALVLF